MNSNKVGGLSFRSTTSCGRKPGANWDRYSLFCEGTYTGASWTSSETSNIYLYFGFGPSISWPRSLSNMRKLADFTLFKVVPFATMVSPKVVALCVVETFRKN